MDTFGSFDGGSEVLLHFDGGSEAKHFDGGSEAKQNKQTKKGENSHTGHKVFRIHTRPASLWWTAGRTAYSQPPDPPKGT